MAKKKPQKRKSSGNQDNKGRFVKGNKANPGGRPKKCKELEILIQEALECDIGSQNTAVNRLLEIAQRGKPGYANESIKLLLQYGYGKPKQRVELTGNDDGPLEIEVTRGLLAGSIARLKG